MGSPHSPVNTQPARSVFPPVLSELGPLETVQHFEPPSSQHLLPMGRLHNRDESSIDGKGSVCGKISSASKEGIPVCK